MENLKTKFCFKNANMNVCMLVLNFENPGMLQTNPLKMKLALELRKG
jgi:hypothetical protein